MTAKCNTCGEEIDFLKTNEFKPDGKPKFKRVNPDGSPHTCRIGNSPAASPAAGTNQAQEGILVSAQGNGVTIWTDARGDRVYAINASGNLCDKSKLPQKVMFTPQKNGFVVINSYLGPVDLKPLSRDIKTAAEIKEENPDRIMGPANGECDLKGEAHQIILPPKPAIDNISTSTSQSPVTRMWSGETKLTIGCTVSLDNFENIKVEVSGPIPDADQLKAVLKDQLLSLGGNEVTRDKIQAYVRRVL